MLVDVVAGGRLLADRGRQLGAQGGVGVVVAGVLQRGVPAVVVAEGGQAVTRSGLRLLERGLLRSGLAGALRSLLVAVGLLRLGMLAARLLQQALLRGGLGTGSRLLRLLDALLCGIAAGPCRHGLVP